MNALPTESLGWQRDSVNVHFEGKCATHVFVLGFNDISTLLGHFVSSTRELEKGDSRGDKRMNGSIFYLETLNPKRA